MKRTLFTLALSLMVGAAGAEWYDGDGGADDGDDFLNFEENYGVDPIYSTPSVNTGSSFASQGSGQRAFVPSNMYVEYFGNMDVRSQAAHLRMFNMYMAVPLTSTERTTWRGWHFDMSASARATWLQHSGVNVLDENRLYTLGLQASVGRKIASRSYLQVGFVPQFSSDFNVLSHEDFYWGCYAAFSSKPSENFRYTLGLALMPDYYDHYVFPMMNLVWRYNPSWELRVQASRFSLANVSHENFHWGPFFQWNAARWTVHREGVTQKLCMTNCILGMGVSYNIKTSSGTNVMLLGDLGCSVYNTFRVRDKEGDRTLEKYRAHSGVYLRFGAQISF